MTSPNTQIYKKIYAKLNALNLFPSEKPFIDDVVFSSSGFMDLHIESLPGYRDESGRSKHIVSFAHYYKQNGDAMRDPDVEFGINHELKEAYPLTYRNDGTGFMDDTQASGSVDFDAEEGIGTFLFNWLDILQQQGFFKTLNSRTVKETSPF